MHEMSITRAMLEIVQERMKQNDMNRVGRIRVLVGKLTAVEPDSLRFCFEVCTHGTSLEGAVLDVEEVPLTGLCEGCRREFFMEDLLSCCPDCGGAAEKMVAGRELDIISMEA